MNIRKNMKHCSGLAILCLTLIADSAATAASSYEINFSGANPLPTSGAFTYDPTTATFSDFTVTWDGLTFDLTNSANNPVIGNAAPACVGSGTPGSQTFALLSGACDGPAQEFTGWEGLDDAGVSYFDFETEKINGYYYDSLTDAGVNQGQGSTGYTSGSFSLTLVPEPSTTYMFICGLALVALGSRKNFRGLIPRVFSVCAGLTSAATLSSASTISYVDLFTTNTYNQTSSAQPTASAGYFLTAHLYLLNPGDFSAANVTMPGGTQPTNGTNNGAAPDMVLVNSTTFQYQSPVLAFSAFNNEFPTGDYTYTATGSPNETVSLYYAGNPDYATSVPYVTDYASLQGMNSTNAFALTLNPFTNALPGGNCLPESGDTCSYVFLSIYDTSGNAVFGQGYAPNTTKSFDIPGGTLQPGQTYTYSLIFSNQQVGSYDSDNNNWMYDPEFWSDVLTNGTFSTAAAVTTPEPSTIGMLAGGLTLIMLGSRKKFRAGRRALGLGAGAILSTSIVSAQVSSHARPKITRAIQENQTIIRSGNVHPAYFSSTTTDLGPMDSNRVLSHMRLQLHRTPEEAKALQDYVDSLGNPTSPNFHQFVTAAQFSEKWGLAQSDMNAVTKWLTSHGFTVHFIYPTLAIDFSGTAKQITETFHTEIHNLRVNGESHFANVTDIQIPAALAAVVLGPVALHDFKPRRQSHAIVPPARPEYTSASGKLVTPADLATIYNLTPLFNAGITGEGQTIVVLSESDLYSVGDFNTFRKTFGLSRLYPLGKLITIHPQPAGSPVTAPNGVEISPDSCADPGDLPGYDREAATDVEWISASAPNATIELATCSGTATHSGIFVALENLITSPGLPPSIVNLSYGEPEADRGVIGNAFINALYQVAASEGISMFVAAGDGGASPDNGSDGAHGVGVSGLASTPNNVAVGGTDYGDAYLGVAASYWSATNGIYFDSALSYVPEIPWNNSCASSLLAAFHGFSTTYGADGFCNSSAGQHFLSPVAGSGGPSGCAFGAPSIPSVVSGTCAGYAKPSWQTLVYGNPSDGVRDLPDVSMFAGNGQWGRGYAMCYSNPADGGKPCPATNPAAWAGEGGTSVGTPVWAGIQALINQATGSAQGNPSPIYYQLAASQYGASGNANCNANLGNAIASNCIFHDITAGDNDVNCLALNGTLHNCFYPSSNPGTNGVLSLSNGAYQQAFSASAGYDLATGIGTPNVFNLVTNYPGATIP